MKAKAITRLIVMAVLAVNAALTLAGKNPIPFDENAITETATQVAAGLSALWAWWKNNNMTQAARLAQEQLNGIKEDGVDGEDSEED